MRRRSESRESSVQSSRQGSVDSQNTDVRTTRRTAAWTSSVESSSPLDDIAEEDVRGGRRTTPTDIEDEYTRNGSDEPSSFPSGNFDISYNQERGQFRPTQGTSSALRDAGKAISAIPGRAWQFSKRHLSPVERAIADVTDRSAALRETAWSISLLLLKATAAVLLMGSAWILLTALFCRIYSRFLCESDTSSALHFSLQKFCGTCISSSTSWHGSDPLQMESLPSDILDMLGSLNKRIGQVESRVDAKHSLLSATLNQVLDRQHVMETTVSSLQHGHPNNPVASPLIQKINYCSAGNGAVVDPYLTSPTERKQFNYIQRLFLATGGMQK